MIDEYLSVASEIKTIEALLAETPEDNVIERMSLEARLKKVKSILANLSEQVKNNEKESNPLDHYQNKSTNQIKDGGYQNF